LPSQKHTPYKVSPSQNTFSQPDFSTSSPEYWSFPLNGLPEIPLLHCLSSALFKNSSSHISFFFVFSSPRTS
jgi:hypothetical protein